VEQPSTTKNDESICHEVKYNPADKASESYKIYMTAFSHGMPEQWLKFMEKLNVVIHGNGLDENGHAHFNLPHLRVMHFISSMIRWQNKKRKQKILTSNVSMP
jgi:hypothetical protein